MSDLIGLTAAELAFVVWTRGSSIPPSVAKALGIGDADQTEAFRMAGLGSLLTRKLATPLPESRVDLAPALVAVAEGLVRPAATVQIGLIAQTAADGALLVESPLARFLVAPRRYRCFDVTGLDRSVEAPEPLLWIGAEFLRHYRPAVVTFTVTTYPDESTRAASMAVGADGTWSYLSGADPAAAVLATEAECTAMLGAELSRLVPHAAPATS
ncbi:MAG TPA: hypothetical protein VFB84_00250 [Micromonosporaceae bacterium]|nr:hypothetical protein [Micromonosporaceae bacterium]